MSSAQNDIPALTPSALETQKDEEFCRFLPKYKDYPHYTRHVLREDILQRNADDPIRIAFELAKEVHESQLRKGVDQLDYLTHPLRVYDLVSCCVDVRDPKRDQILCAALLHDVLEDYRPAMVDAGVRSRADIRKEAEGVVKKAFKRAAFPDDESRKAFVGELLALMNELTNPLEYKSAGEESKTKHQWQTEHFQSASTPAKIVKIADKTANIISNIEERPVGKDGVLWDAERHHNYANDARDMVEAAKSHVSPDDPYAPAIAKAFALFDDIEKSAQSVIDSALFPDAQRASVYLGAAYRQEIAAGRWSQLVNQTKHDKEQGNQRT